MKKQLQLTMDELVDSQLRLYNSSKTAKRQMLVTGVLAFIPLALLGALMYTVDLIGYKVLGGVLIIGFIPFHIVAFPKYIAWRMRKYLQELYGKSNQIEYELEFAEDAVNCRVAGTGFQLYWEDFTQLVELVGEFELWVEKRGLVVIRRWYFDSDEEYRQWLQFARTRATV